MPDALYAAAPRDPAAWVARLSLAMTIDGADAAAASHLDILDPVSETLVAQAPIVDAAGAEQAVRAAHAAFPAWARTPWQDRRERLEAFAKALEEQQQTLSILLTCETGKPLRRALSEVLAGIDYVRTIAAQTLPDRDYIKAGGGVARLEHRPLGVVAAIAPWNGPVVLALAKIANALLAGDTLVLKPSPFTPLTALYMGQLARGHFPAGVFNVVAGDADVGVVLTSHPMVAKVSFTGSTATGRAIAAAAAPTLKRLTLELGGNDAAIVLPDADLDRATPFIFAIAFAGAGQFCAGIKRLYVHDAIHDEVRDRMVALAEATKVGAGWDAATDMGPVQNGAQYARIVGLLDDARQAGGRILTGGPLNHGPGFFLRPAIVEGLTHGARLVDEEQFGPALPLIRFSRPEDALAMANQDEYGLGGSVWTRDINAGVALARELEVGTAWINQHGAFSAALPMPFARQSGLGMDYAEFGIAEHSRAMLINAA
ncbi:aldehyde dehydrogenase family protein [Caulobacter sp.]|uniref:aldehyde dehydrogenase family protein n=1 Tax=Caulobacter sp. TaxID=78 RepID=UPI003BA9D715